jgi:hypothetical protein
VDREGDADRASDGYSRYGVYVLDREREFTDPWAADVQPLEPLAFAIKAFEVACPPIMSPGLVDWRPDVHTVSLGYDEDGNHLMVTVELPIKHSQLAAKIPYGYTDWALHRHWSHDDYQYLTYPGTRRDRPTVLATVKVTHVLAHVTLVTPGRPTGRPLVDDALRSVELTAAAINAELPEIINTVQGDK